MQNKTVQIWRNYTATALWGDEDRMGAEIKSLALDKRQRFNRFEAVKIRQTNSLPFWLDRYPLKQPVQCKILRVGSK